MNDPWRPIQDIASDVLAGKTTAEENVKEALKRAKADEFDCMLEVYEDAAIACAKEVDSHVKNSEYTGRLVGVPFVAKDNFLVFGGKTTAASNILNNFEAPYQATAIEKLEQEGAICIGKANLDAFAHGSSTENSDFKTTKNPHDPTRVPGGSSGGSAAVVAANIVPFALGTDTGGSIRLPASFCGVVGYKPTYGLVSRHGVIAMASSTDVIGPLARTVGDAALVLDVMAGEDHLDGTTIKRSEHKYTGFSSANVTVGVVKEHMTDGVDEAVLEKVQSAIDKLKTAGVTVKEVSLPTSDLALACYYIVVPAEVSSNLARYDGIRFGYSSEKAKDLNDVYEQSRTEGFGDEAKRRIMIGNYVLSSGYYDAYYKKAQQVRTMLISDYNKALEDVDVLVGPVTPSTAFKIGENVDDPLKMYLTDIMTVTANLVGAPAASVPIGNVDNLPVGLHISAKQKEDSKVLSLAHKIQELLK